MKTLKLLTIAGGAFVLSALSAHAVVTAAQFRASVPAGASDMMAVYNSAGAVVGSATSFEPESPDTVREVNTNLANPTQIGNYYLVYEPDGVTLSDIVGVAHETTFGAPHAVFAYVSGPLNIANWVGAGKAFDGVLLGTFIEGTDGIVVDLTSLINPSGGAKGGNAYFFSDGNVPDGGSAVALLGIALTGIEAGRRLIRARKA